MYIDKSFGTSGICALLNDKYALIFKHMWDVGVVFKSHKAERN